VSTGLPDRAFSNQKSIFGYILPWNRPRWYTYFAAIYNILQPFGLFHGHLVFFVVLWQIFPRFGMLYREESGNPVSVERLKKANWVLPGQAKENRYGGRKSSSSSECTGR
jgi:hypothetical protein